MPQNLDRHLYEDETSVPCVSTALTLAGPAGELEAITAFPLDSGVMRAIGVICHPHPLYGGTLTNKVVHSVSCMLNDLGIGTVRFNFRGVGASAGRYANGIGETEDLIAVIDWVHEQYPGYALWLAGFSFGAYIALQGTLRRAVAQLITIAPPVNMFDFKAITPPTCPWLLIQGGQDEIVPCAEVMEWAHHLQYAPRVICMQSADHFFHGRLNDLREVLRHALAPQGADAASAGQGAAMAP